MRKGPEAGEQITRYPFVSPRTAPGEPDDGKRATIQMFAVDVVTNWFQARAEKSRSALAESKYRPVCPFRMPSDVSMRGRLPEVACEMSRPPPEESAHKEHRPVPSSVTPESHFHHARRPVRFVMSQGETVMVCAFET
jgi:hypothetical protein